MSYYGFHRALTVLTDFQKDIQRSKALSDEQRIKQLENVQILKEFVKQNYHDAMMQDGLSGDELEHAENQLCSRLEAEFGPSDYDEYEQ